MVCRWAGGVVAVVVVALTGCGGGNPSACPTPQPCVHFVGTPPSAVGGNGSAPSPPGDDMARAAPPDMATTPLDLSSPPGDLAATPKDLATAACVPTGGDCTNHNDAVCCSKYCVYATNTCR